MQSDIVSSADSSSDSTSFKAGHWERIFTYGDIHPFATVNWRIADAVIKDRNGDIIFEQRDIEVPDFWNQSTINVVADKYFRVINGVKENSAKQMFSRVARKITEWAHSQSYFNTSEDSRVYEEELIYALLHQFGAFNSPVWFNLGVPGRSQTASACFISGVEDSLDDIANFQLAELVIFRSGSGSGANLSKLRSSYERLSSGSYTSGPLAFMKGFDAFAGAMKSGGSTRSAAKMAVLDIDHPDILETKDGRPGFIRCKAFAERIARQLIEAGHPIDYDNPNSASKLVPYQNANHSTSISDKFMEAVEKDGDWNTIARTDKSVIHTYKARSVFREIAESAWECGDPGVQYSDTLNKWHTTPQSGPIRGSNPCSEFTHIDNTACNLCAINLTKFFPRVSDHNGEHLEFQHESFEQAVRLFSTAQMAIISKADYPTDKIRENSHKLRPIGTNYGDLGALLMKLGYGYDSDQGRAVAARLASLMTGIVYRTSSELASRVGSFEDFPKNRKDMLSVMCMHQRADSDILRKWNLSVDPISSDIQEHSSRVWTDVINLGSKYGFNISQATLQAPLGTISFIMGMSTTGIEPAFSLVSYKSMVGGGFMKIVNSGVSESLINLGYDLRTRESILEYMEKNGFMEGAPGMSPNHLPIFDCAMPSGPSGRSLSPRSHLRMMEAIQPLITCAMSKTVNLPHETTVEEIEDIYLESWKMGLKCVALYRDGSKASQPLSSKKESSNTSTPEQESPIDNKLSSRRHMPADVNGWRHRLEIDGYKGYMIVNEYEDGTPGEVFLKLGKPGTTVAGLVDGFTRLLSIALQHGVPLPKLIESFVDTRFEPSGFTADKHIKFAKSLYDYLFKKLDVKYYDGNYSGLAERVQAIKEKEEIRETIAKSTKDPDFSVLKPIHKSPESSAKSLGSLCVRCGGIMMKTGTCYTCTQCGSSGGCGLSELILKRLRILSLFNIFLILSLFLHKG
jgi:ribonucleoside-diphosphate reductase alpha chain